MGNSCCRQSDSQVMNPDSKKIMKAVGKKDEKSDQIFIQIYDVENEIGREIELNIRFLKLEGMSQLNLNNTLYLCGCANEKSEIYGSTLVRINPMVQPVQIDYLISSANPHYFPSITHILSENLAVIGGKNSVNCEMFNIKRCKWVNLPDLPEERYGAIVVSDEANLSIYLFGGFNSNSKKVHSSILKLNLKTKLRWDTIVTVTDHAELVTKCFSSVCRVSKSTVLIVGGKSNSEEECDDVIECNLSAKSQLSVRNKFKSNSPALYKNSNLAGETPTHFFTFDDFSMIHKISKFDNIETVSSFFDSKEDYQSFTKVNK